MIDADEYFASPFDAGRMARFYNEKFVNKFKSDLAKEPVYDDKVMVEIRTMGSKDVFTSPIREKDILDFPEAWDAFNGKSVIRVGTSLSKVEGIGKMQEVYYLSKGIRTAEQLAELTDGNVGGYGEGSWLHREAARKLVGWKADRAEKARDDEIKSLQAQLDQMKTMLAEKNGNEEIKAIDAAEAAEVVEAEKPEEIEEIKPKKKVVGKK